MNKYMVLILIVFLSGCGVEVASTAAAVAEAKAQEAKEAERTKEHLTTQINQALAAGQQQLRDADQTAP